MSETHEPFRVEQMFRTAVEGFQANQFMSKSQFYAAVILNDRLPNIADDHGFELCSVTYRFGSPLGLLVLKATIGEIPSVCFINCRDILTGVLILARMLQENRVPWKRDKFR